MVLVAIGFLLEADGAVGLLAVAETDQCQQPLQPVEPEEQRQGQQAPPSTVGEDEDGGESRADHQQLHLLTAMYALVTQCVVGEPWPCLPADEDERPQRDGNVAWKRNEGVAYYEHLEGFFQKIPVETI